MPFPSGSRLAGLFFTCNSARFLWFSKQTTASTSSRQGLSSQVCTLASFTAKSKTRIQKTDTIPAMCIGVILATIISIGQEKIASRFKLLPPTAEGRLYFSCIESAFMPIGLFWFGWTSYPSIPYIVPALAVGCATMGIFSIYLAVFNYLADTYHRYASSAIAAQSCCKCQSVPFAISHRLSVLFVSPCLPRFTRI